MSLYYIPRHGAGPIIVLRSRSQAAAAWCDCYVDQLCRLLEYMELERIQDQIDARLKEAVLNGAEEAAPEIQRRAKLPRPPRSTRPACRSAHGKQRPARVARSNC